MLGVRFLLTVVRLAVLGVRFLLTDRVVIPFYVILPTIVVVRRGGLCIAKYYHLLAEQARQLHYDTVCLSLLKDCRDMLDTRVAYFDVWWIVSTNRSFLRNYNKIVARTEFVPTIYTECVKFSKSFYTR